jgi:RNA-directed DNA polymerase
MLFTGKWEKIDLEIKPNERVFPVEEGIDFLGYVIRPDYVRLRKRIKQKFARKMLGFDTGLKVLHYNG